MRLCSSSSLSERSASELSAASASSDRSASSVAEPALVLTNDVRRSASVRLLVH
jgi:hypothetical protein